MSEHIKLENVNPKAVLIFKGAYRPEVEYEAQNLTDLVKSISVYGVRQPLIGRTDGHGTVEVVAGLRRLHAAIEVGLKSIPVMVSSEMSDREATLLQLVENGQRKDVHPVYEAEAFNNMADQYKLTVDEIADQIDKSPSYVARRMVLKNLPASVRKALEAEDIPLRTALLIARLPRQDQRKAAAKGILKGDRDYDEATKKWVDCPLSYNDARSYIVKSFQLDLELAQFNLHDPKLVAAAGSCEMCPKRTKNQVNLFAGVGSDMCLDGVCFKKKQNAFWKFIKTHAKDLGHTVLPVATAKKIFSQYNDGLEWQSSLVDLDGEPDGLSAGNGKSWREYLKDDLDGVKVSVGQHPRSGRVLFLAEPKEVRKILSGKGLAQFDRTKDGRVKPRKVSDAEKLSRKEEKRHAKVATDARNEFLAKMQVAVESGKIGPKDLWRLICLGCIERAWSDTSKDVGKRREIEVESQAGYVYQKALNAFAMGENQAIKTLPTNGQLASLTLELVLSPCVFGFSNQEIVKLAEKILGTKVATITKRLDKASKKKAVKK